MTIKVTIELTKEQAFTLMETLELYSRLKMGQFDELIHSFYMDTYDKTLKRPEFDREMAKAYLMQARSVIFTDLDSGAYIGISHTSEGSKISWDLYKKLQHDLTVYTNPNPQDQMVAWGNAYDPPYALSKQPLPKIVITDGEKQCRTDT